MDIDTKLSILETIEDLEPWANFGNLGAAGGWIGAANGADLGLLSEYAPYLMAASAALSILIKFSNRYKKRLLARVTFANPQGVAP